MIGELLLLSGNDIPFPEARVTIHQPTLKEIAYIGEEKFFLGCGFLDFSKKMLNDLDKTKLADYSDFNILMLIISQNSKETRQSIEAAFLVLNLIFPLYEISVRDNLIVLKKDNEEYFLNEQNFDAFKKILGTMFNLKLGKSDIDNYNPKGEMAKRIADKFKKRHEKLAQLKGESNKEGKASILSRYASILAVGLQKDFNSLMLYTVYQLQDEFQRFQLKMQWDAYVQARMAGAQNLDEVDNWTIDLKDQGKNKNKK